MSTPADYHFPHDLDAAYIGLFPEQPVERRADDSCFLSIRFPHESRLRAPGTVLDGIRNDPTLPEHFHLTLLSSEHCTDEQLAIFLANLSPIMPFSVEVTGLKILGNGDVPALVWSIDPGPALGRLQAELYNSVVNENMDVSSFSEPGSWIPHITIAYDLDGALDPNDFPQIAPFRLMVNSFTIGRSYDDYFEVSFPRGIGDRMFVQQHGDHVAQEGRPGQMGGSQEGYEHAGGNSIGGDGLKGSIRKNKESQQFIEISINSRLRQMGRSREDVSVRYGKAKGIEGSAGLVISREDGTEIRVDLVEGEHGNDPTKIIVFGLFASEKGTGLGTAAMFGLRDYADEKDKPLVIEAVANRKFFRRLPWLSEDKSGNFVYEPGSKTTDVEKTRYGIETEISVSQLAKLVHGGQIVKGVLRRAFGIEDGPFTVKHGDHIGQKGTPEGGSQPGFTHAEGSVGDDGGVLSSDEVVKSLRSRIKASDVKGLRVRKQGSIYAGLWAVIRPAEETFSEEQAEALRNIFGKDIRAGDPNFQMKIKEIENVLAQRAGENMYLPTPSFGRAGQDTRGTAGSKQDGSKVGMKKQDTGFNADGKKRKFGLPHHQPIELFLPDNENLQELLDAIEEWEGSGRSTVFELLHEEDRELDPIDELIQVQVIEWFDNPDSQDIPLAPDEMFGMTDGEIQSLLEKEAEALIEEHPEPEPVEAEAPEFTPEILDRDSVGRGRVYTFARDSDEIAAVLMTTMIEENDYRLGQLANGAQAIAYNEQDELLPPLFQPENYTDESFESGYLYVDWLAAKHEGHGYGRQMLGEIFRQAAEINSGVYLEATESALAFYQEFLVNTTDDDTVFWTVEEVKEWAETAKEETVAFVGENLVEREDISEVLFGTDQPEFRPINVDDDSEPLDGGYTIGNMLWPEKPRPWKRQFKVRIEEAEFMTDEDAAVLEAAQPQDQRMPDERETMLQGVQRALENLVSLVFTKRHGDHVDQQGTPEGGSRPGYTHAEGSVEGEDGSEEIFHGTGAEVAKSIMETGLQISYADDDNWLPDVIYAAADRRDALAFAARSPEENYAVITIDSSLAGSGESPPDGSIGLTFNQDIPPEAIVKIDIYERGFQRKDDQLIETIERTEEESPPLFIAAAITENGDLSVLGPTQEFESNLFDESVSTNDETGSESETVERVVGPLRRVVRGGENGDNVAS